MKKICRAKSYLWPTAFFIIPFNDSIYPPFPPGWVISDRGLFVIYLFYDIYIYISFILKTFWVKQKTQRTYNHPPTNTKSQKISMICIIPRWNMQQYNIYKLTGDLFWRVLPEVTVVSSFRYLLQVQMTAGVVTFQCLQLHHSNTRWVSAARQRFLSAFKRQVVQLWRETRVVSVMTLSNYSNSKLPLNGYAPPQLDRSPEVNLTNVW